MNFIESMVELIGHRRRAASALPPQPDPTLARALSSAPLPIRRRLPRAFRSSRQGGFEAASTSRLFNDWPTSRISRDSHLRSQLVSIRSRCRQLADDDEYAGGFLRNLKTNVVGPNGFRLSMAIKDERDPKKQLPDDFANDAIETAWKEWSKPENCTVSRTLSRVDTEDLILNTLARDGEFLVRLVYGWKKNNYRFALQPIESDYLDEEKWISRPGSNIRMGVEYNAWQEPRAYWLRTWNPADLMSTHGPRRSEPFPARDEDDRPLYLHKYLRDYAEQSRGVPWFHNAMTRLKMLGGWEFATLDAARSAACKRQYFTQDPDHPVEYTGDAETAAGDFLADFEPGTSEILPPGWGVHDIDPSFPTNNEGAFNKAILRGVASGLGVSYNSLAKDLEGVNFSSIRAGLLEDRDVWKRIQAWMIVNYELPVFTAWLEMSLLAGAIKLPNGSALPYRKFAQFNQPLFNGRRWQWVDPVKEGSAAVMNIESQLTTRQQALDNSDGGDFEDICRGIQRERRIAAKYGVELTTPKTVVTVGAPEIDLESAPEGP